MIPIPVLEKIRHAIETIRTNDITRIDNDKEGWTVYKVGNIIRIDIKKDKLNDH